MAKPLTRLARTILNRMGYDLLRLQKTNIHHEARSGLGRGEGFDAFEAILPRPVKSFDIYFRCCARVEIFGQSRNRIGQSCTLSQKRYCRYSVGDGRSFRRRLRQAN